MRPTKIPLLMTTAASALPLRMTLAERSRGRFMRAPDHPGGGDPAPSEAPVDPAPVDSGAPADTAPAEETTGDDESTVLGGGSEGAEEPAKGAEAGEGGDQAATPAGAPEKYELTAPEGSTFDAEAFEAVEPVLRELGLSNDQAQKLVDGYAEKIVPQLMERANTAVLQRAADTRREWADAFAADPEIGGPNKERTIADAARAFDHYGLKKGEGVRQLLDESGLGNHPDLIRFVARVGRDLDEASFDRGEPVKATKAAEQKLYGDEFQPKS